MALLLYVAGPYRADTPEGVAVNIQRAREVAIAIWEAGHYALCPHLNTARFEVDCHVPDQAYLDGDIVMLSRCDGIVMVPGWGSSDGAGAERRYAIHHGIPVYHYPHPGIPRVGDDGV
jgi:hypothetical protein